MRQVALVVSGCYKVNVAGWVFFVVLRLWSMKLLRRRLVDLRLSVVALIASWNLMIVFVMDLMCVLEWMSLVLGLLVVLLWLWLIILLLMVHHHWNELQLLLLLCNVVLRMHQMTLTFLILQCLDVLRSPDLKVLLKKCLQVKRVLLRTRNAQDNDGDWIFVDLLVILLVPGLLVVWMQILLFELVAV